MIILNEKEYVSNVLQTGKLDFKKIHTFLNMYARFLYHEEGLRKKGITEKLNQFMQNCYPKYNPVDWSSGIEKYALKADRYPLCECNGVWITENELKTIEGLQDKVLERLAFTLLCLAKYRNFKNPNNDNWVNYSNGEIYNMACINTSSFNKDIKLNLLREMGLIEYAKKVSSLSVRILFTDTESQNKLFVSDFRKIGYEWRLYKGEKYIRCADCGILTRNTNGKQKYCAECAEKNKKERDRIRMRNIRNVEFVQSEKPCKSP